MEYTKREMMIVAAARELKDEEVVFVGVGIPLISSRLAKMTHAPNLVLLFAGGSIDPRTEEVLSTCGPEVLNESISVSFFEVYELLQRGRVDVAFIGGAQIDRYGNVNSTAIGGYPNPKARLTGSGAANDMASLAKRTVITTNLEKRRFVEKVDYITSPGYLGGGDDRKLAGLRWGGPKRIVTDACIFEFHEETKEIMLRSVYPGVTIEKIKENTGFDFIVGDVEEVDPPTEEELLYLRKIT
ncbi:MAG: CoA-transferase subunit beta [Candidatus Syntropharchaeia archaeon]